MATARLPSEPALEALEKVLSSRTFAGAERSSKLLRFLVESTVRGQADRLKEYTLGTEALGRGDGFDPRIDSIARVEVSRLRSRLEQYYATEGRTDAIGIVLPRGTYVPVFEKQPAILDRAEPDHAAKPPASQPLIWFASAILVIAAGFVVLLWSPWQAARPAERPFLQFDVRLAAGEFAGTVIGADVALAPDGKSLVFGKYLADGSMRLASRRLDQREVIVLTGTEGARGPFFSPDGQWVAFWAAGKLKKIPVGGGSPINLCDATELLGGSWGDDGNIIAALDSSGRLWRVPSSGGSPKLILDLAQESLVPRWPQVLPRAKTVLFTSFGPLGPDAGNIEALSLEDGRRKTLVRGGTYGRYLPGGDLIYVNQGTLYAIPFDLHRLEVRDSPVAVLHDLSYSSMWGFAQLDISRDGTLVYRRAPGGGQSTVQWLDSRGNLTPLLAKPARYESPRLSPEGNRLAFAVSDSGSTNISISEDDPSRTQPLTSGDGIHTHPVWSPDGRYIVYGNGKGMWQASTDGPAKQEPLTESAKMQIPWSFTPDGERLAFFENSPTTGYDVWTVALHADAGKLQAGKPEPFLTTRAFEVFPTFSPDGRWIAYGSNKSGAWEVYVCAFPDGHGEVRISSEAGRVSRWPRNDHEIFYRTDDGHIMAVAYTVEGGSFKAATARRWSEKPLVNSGVIPNFDVAPDGKRLAAVLPAVSEEGESTNEVTFLLNFSDEVQRRVGQTRR